MKTLIELIRRSDEQLRTADDETVAAIIGVVQEWLGQDDMRRVIWSADIEDEARQLGLGESSSMRIAELRASAVQRALVTSAGFRFGDHA